MPQGRPEHEDCDTATADLTAEASAAWTRWTEGRFALWGGGRFHRTPQEGALLKNDACLISDIPHLIFSGCG